MSWLTKQSIQIKTPKNDKKTIKNSFEANYEKLYSRTLPNADIEILTWSLSLSIMGKNITEYLELDSYKKIKENSLIDYYDYQSGDQIKIPKRVDCK